MSKGRGYVFALGVAGSILALACFGGDAKPLPEPTPVPTVAAAPSVGGPEAVLARHAETTYQKPLVEDCTKADVAKDVGKICAAFRGERGQQRAYVVGLTFSEFTDWVILENSGSAWNVVSTLKITPDNAAVRGIPWPLRTGVEVVVSGTGQCLNVREGPGLSQKAVDCIADGVKIRLAAGPQIVDNIQWWQVEGRTGWVAGDYLRYPDALS